MEIIVNLLSLDTTSTSGSISVKKGKKIVFSTFLNIEATHSERILPQVCLALDKSNLDLSNLDGIIFCNGPGSFTGLRIGLSTVKGISYSKKIPVLPVNSLKALACNVYPSERNILTIIDAKVNEIYGALFTPNLKEIITPKIFNTKELVNLIKEPVVILGDGLNVCQEYLKNLNIDFIVGKDYQNYIWAHALFSLAIEEKKIPSYDFEFLSNLEPYYLRKSQAELNKKKL